ncbi:MAG TPA: DUF2148 domain-containing protein [Methanospirillum sp.]|uniref:ferredoxin domain-containing protein n=1 Tax=Methanospirillum sp. TaxID=45200 RepID=UPI002C0B1DA5|nr:DUF2148 domain-containing protein [Methanospirillum sp.]HWQ65012.1 DUF2148 domain-containing protein [Methanospirillum sp.]
MDPEEEAVRTIANLMAVSVRTAPKGKGTDTIETKVLYGQELVDLAREMEIVGTRIGFQFFMRDAKNIAVASACVLIGCHGEQHLGLNCGGCGFDTCKEMVEAFGKRKDGSLYKGPVCAIRMADLGIAVGSAVKTAQIHNADNRVFFSAGVAALSLGLLPGCTTAYAIPLSITGKNIFFDR